MKILSFKKILLLAVAMISVCSFAKADDPPGTVPYTSRRAITQIASKAHPELGPEWDEVKKSMAQTLGGLVAQAHESTPPAALYFFGRDGEPLYDLAVAMGLNKRTEIKLINVGRKSVDDPNMVHYLGQNGLSDSDLNNRKAIWVDTGWRGNLQNKMLEKLPPESRSKVSVRLMLSATPDFPSTRTFLNSLGGREGWLNDPMSMRARLKEFELLPHETGTALSYKQVDGQWVPMSAEHEKSSQDSKWNNWREDIRNYGESFRRKGRRNRK